LFLLLKKPDFYLDGPSPQTCQDFGYSASLCRHSFPSALVMYVVDLSFVESGYLSRCFFPSRPVLIRQTYPLRSGPPLGQDLVGFTVLRICAPPPPFEFGKDLRKVSRPPARLHPPHRRLQLRFQSGMAYFLASPFLSLVLRKVSSPFFR